MIPWIQVYTNVGCHPKTARLAELLELKSGSVQPVIVAVGMLVSVWSWAAQNAYDGDLSGVSPSVIADACRWKKAPQKLWDALVGSGYLDEDGKLHDWSEYHVLLMDAEERRREKSRERSLRYRQRKEAKRHACVTVTSVTNHAPTIPYQNHTENDVDNDDTLSLSSRVCEKTELQPSEAVAIRRGGATERADIGACGDEAERRLLGRERVREGSLPCVKGGGICEANDGGIVRHRNLTTPQALRASSPYTGEPCEGAQGSHAYEDIDGAVRSAIRRRWGRDADERDLARGRREFVFLGENGGLRAYDDALVDYVFSVSEGAGAQAQNWRFVEGVMRKLRQRGIVTVEDALDYEEERV